jgi:hypothetical protein
MKLFSFSAWNTSLHVLAFKVSLRNLLWFWWVYLCMLLFFSITAFNILSLLSVLVVLIICHGVVLFWSCLFGVLEASCTWMGIAFSRFGKFSVIILLSILWILLLAPLLLQCPWFSGLVFWWSCWVLHIPFTGFELFESQFFTFSFSVHLIFKFWDSVFSFF